MHYSSLEQPYRGLLDLEDIKQLAKLIEKALLHFNQYQSSCENTYLDHLRLITHCYQLVLIENGEQRPSLQFSTFKNSTPQQIYGFSLQIAEMINTVVSKIPLIDYPWFYSHFTAAVRYILGAKLCYQSNDLEIAHRLLRQLMQPPVRRIML